MSNMDPHPNDFPYYCGLPEHFNISLRQIPYPCPDPSFEFSDPKDVLEQIYVAPLAPLHPSNSSIKKRDYKQINRITDVPDLNDVDSFLAKPDLVVEDYLQDEDLQLILYHQDKIFDYLNKSYEYEPNRSYYLAALEKEIESTLADAWVFHHVPLSVREARDAAHAVAGDREFGVSNEMFRWVEGLKLSRAQNLAEELEIDDDQAKQCLLWGNYSLDDHYDLKLGKTPHNQDIDNFYGAGSITTSPLSSNEIDEGYHEPSIATTWVSLPEKEVTRAVQPSATTTTTPFQDSGIHMEDGYAEAYLPDAPPNSAIYPIPSRLYSFVPIPESVQYRMAPPTKPTFKAVLAPLRKPKQTTPRLAIFGDDGEVEWEGRQDAPYDFVDFAPPSPESVHDESPIGSDGSAETLIMDRAAFLESAIPIFNFETPGMDEIEAREIAMYTVTFGPSVWDVTPSPKTTMLDGNIEVDSGLEMSTANDASIVEVGQAQFTDPTMSTMPNTEGHGHKIIQMIETTAQAISQDLHSKHSIPNTVEDIRIINPGSRRTPEEAVSLVQDLEQTIGSAIEQATSMTQEWTKTPPPPALGLPLVKISTVHNAEKDGGLLVASTQPTIGEVQTHILRHPPPQDCAVAFITPTARRVHDVKLDTFATPSIKNLTPEYDSDGEDNDKASHSSLGIGVSSPINKTLGGQSALSLFVQQIPKMNSLRHSSSTISESSLTASEPEPQAEDLAFTPANANLDDLEAVSLIETPALASPSNPNANAQDGAMTPGLHALGPSQVEASTPQNGLSMNSHAPASFQTDTPTPVMAPNTPGTPTPTQKAKHQHHHGKNLLNTFKALEDPKETTRMQNSVKNVFKSSTLGTRSPSPTKGPWVTETGQRSWDDCVKRNPSPIQAVNSSMAPHRTNSPEKATVASPASVRTSRTKSQAEAVPAQTPIPMSRTKSQDQTAKAVVVPAKRRRAQTQEEEVNAAAAAAGAKEKKESAPAVPPPTKKLRSGRKVADAIAGFFS